MTLSLPATAFGIILLTGCAGYQLGGVKPGHLRGVSAVHVATTENKTTQPRAAAQATNYIVDAFTQDGTYRLTTIDSADARLESTLETIDYRQIRSTRDDSLESEELEMTVHLTWSLIDGANPLQLLESGRATGRTRFFVDPNLQTAQRNALSDALERAAQSIVARLADGF